MCGLRRVVVDPCKPVHLKIDPGWRKIGPVSYGSGWLMRCTHSIVREKVISISSPLRA